MLESLRSVLNLGNIFSGSNTQKRRILHLYIRPSCFSLWSFIHACVVLVGLLSGYLPVFPHNYTLIYASSVSRLIVENNGRDVPTGKRCVALISILSTFGWDHSDTKNINSSNHLLSTYHVPVEAIQASHRYSEVSNHISLFHCCVSILGGVPGM